jgi:glycerol-3-phosphate dehydrogenase subunit C
MDESCLMFPELYRLFDREKESGRKITSGELRRLVELCNFCALCPCPNIRADLLTAKTRIKDRDGVGWRIRLIEDVERIGKVCGQFPKLSNALFQGKEPAGHVKEWLGIHPERKFPVFPGESFSIWVKNQKLDIPPVAPAKRKVAYFPGCTAKILFPEVARATVGLLQNLGVSVHCPELRCCGMPTYLEGDRDKTLGFVRFNLDQLSRLVKNGYDIVCSCPTCGYVLKTVLKSGAYYSDAYQEAVGSEPGVLKIPAEEDGRNRTNQSFNRLSGALYGKILNDDGYFSSVDPLSRILVAENTYDLGDYLFLLMDFMNGQLEMAPVKARAVYYPPCHLREQQIGTPYVSLLNRIPDMRLHSVDWSLYCCGMAGIMGFKKDFHHASIRLGRALIKKIRTEKPDMVITDCLSCRLQFQQNLPQPVFHPVEILMKSCI